jgi:plastocyanin
MTRTTTRTLAAVGALVLGLSACGGDDTEPAADTTTTSTSEATADGSPTDDPGHEHGDGDHVSIRTFSFEPDPLTTTVGAEVTWTQLDNTTHTVTSGTREAGPDGRFDARLDQDEEFSFTFDEPGTYPYYCTLHSGPGMTGEVIVG